MSNNFQNQLDKQLRFIESSCKAYDLGDNDESVRIATSLRVLCHNSNASVSLLHHLGQTGRQMFSTNGRIDPPLPAEPPRVGLFHGLTAPRIRFSEDPAALNGTWYEPKFGSGCWVNFATWWDEETIFEIDGENITRKQLVLSAANKDGGAHVDHRLNPKYERIAMGDAGFKVLIPPDRKTFTLTEHPIASLPTGEGISLHITSFGAAAALRQIGYEALVSFRRAPVIHPVRHTE